MFNELSRKIQKFSEKGQKRLSQGFTGAGAWMGNTRSRTWSGTQRSEWSQVIKAKGRYVGGEGRWDRVWDRLDLETHPKCATFEAQIWPSGSYPYLHGHPEREPSPPLHPWVLWLSMGKGFAKLECLYWCICNSNLRERPSLIMVKKLIPMKPLCW